MHAVDLLPAGAAVIRALVAGSAAPGWQQQEQLSAQQQLNADLRR
jgi:hypothetical protein